MSDICELEDLNKDCCVNCFNGLPAYGCPKQEDESRKLMELVHQKAEQINKKHYNEGYQQGRADAIEEIENKVIEWDMNSNDGWIPCGQVTNWLELLKEQKNG